MDLDPFVVLDLHLREVKFDSFLFTSQIKLYNDAGAPFVFSRAKYIESS
jgi:hypothetical protein